MVFSLFIISNIFFSSNLVIIGSTDTKEVKKDWIHHMNKQSDIKHANSKSQGSQSYYLDTIFHHIGTTTKDFVEFGFNEPNYTSGGSGANTWKLYDDGWRGLLLDGDRENLSINLHKHYLFQSNIGTLFEHYKVNKKLDYLSVDMDSHDLFVLKGIMDAGYRPRVITTEYNANYPHDFSLTQIDPQLLDKAAADKYSFNFKGCMWGAAPGALRLLLEPLGYVVIGRVSVLDLFWVQKEILDYNALSVPDFDFFFSFNPMVKILNKAVLHPPVTVVDDLKYIIDYETYIQSGNNVSVANKKALEILKAAKLPCFNSVIF